MVQAVGKVFWVQYVGAPGPHLNLIIKHDEGMDSFGVLCLVDGWYGMVDKEPPCLDVVAPGAQAILDSPEFASGDIIDYAKTCGY